MSAENTPAISFGVVQVLPFPAARVWPVLGDFSRLPDWFPGIGDFSAQGVQPGATRRIVIPPFPAVTHRLERQDDAAMFTQYRVVDGPGLSETTGFVVTIRLHDDAAGCTVDWQARLAQRPALVPAGGEAAFAARTEQSYRRALDRLVARLTAGEV
ncbi:MAG: SRPBCC family protein [Pseudomonadota bacterium]